MKKFNLFIILILAAVVLAVFSTNLPQVEAELLIPPTPQVNPNQAALDSLQSQRNAASNPEQIAQLEEKMAPMTYRIAVQEEAQQQAQPSLQEICANQVQMDIREQARPAGILETRPDFLVPIGYRITNMWRGSLNGLETEVYSGQMFDDPQQGVVILSIPALEIFRTFTDPNPDGFLTIQSEDKLRLVLLTENGTARYFDIPAQQFTAELESVLPAADLPPLPTPVYDPCAQFDQP